MEVEKPTAEEAKQAADKVTAPFLAHISMENPLDDYQKLVETKLQVDVAIDDQFIERNYKQISLAGRDTVTKLIFGICTKKEPEKKELQAANHEKAAKLLKALKADACFYDPWVYNEWIVWVRNELIRRNMLDFWRNYIVKEELGPCWARDSDFFDDLDDVEPEMFYNYAGCKAPFKAAIENCPTGISYENCIADYINRIDYNREKLIGVLTEVRDFIWDLLFKEDTLSKERFKKAEGLLVRFKLDASAYYPQVYNEWIVKLRDELFKRKYFEFWTEVVIKMNCGMCSLENSENDKKAEEFLKSSAELLSKEKENKS